jgi:hypothetical protein
VISRPPVSSKANFVSRYRAGEFGNASPTWETFDDWLKDFGTRMHLLDRFHIRNRVAGGPTYYDLVATQMVVKYQTLTRDLGIAPSTLYFSQMAPTHLTLFQGELQRTHRGLELFYSCQRKTMREALALDGKQVYGSVASRLLEHFLPPVDLEWLYGLLDRYPDHVVEFSTYEVYFGTVEGYKTVYWECRKY